MSDRREVLEDQLESYGGKLKGLKSYITELKAMTEKHGTDAAHFEEDLHEAEHNIKWYETSIEEIRVELKGLPLTPTSDDKGIGARPPAKRGIGSALAHSISFVAGALLGSLVKGRGGAKEGSGKKSDKG